MKYTLIQDDQSGDKVIHEFYAVELSKLLRQIRYFLEGCSYVISPEEELLIDKPALFEQPE